MSAERHIPLGQYGLAKITIDGSDYYFNVIEYNYNTIEDKHSEPNIFGYNKNKIAGYYIEWSLILGTLITNTDVTPNITKAGANIYNFLNSYHGYYSQEKSFKLIPAFGTEATFNVLNNRTSFDVICTKPPVATPYKKTNVKLGVVLELNVITQSRISYADFQYFYRNTSDASWNNVGGEENVIARDGGADKQLIVKNGGVDTDLVAMTD